MSFTNSKIFKIILAGAIFLIVCAIICGTWLYTGRLSGAKIKFFTKFYLPYALVNSSQIPISEFVFRYSLAKNIQSDPNAQVEKEVSSELVKEEEVRQLLSGLGTSVSQKQVDEEYGYQTEQNDALKKTSFEKLLSLYGLTNNEFKNEVIKPQLQYTNLKIWYNSQNNLNPETYAEATDLLKKISQGQDMGALALEYSQDELGRSTEGDLGFVQIIDLLPELREPVANLNVGDVKIIPDRNGLHILKDEGENDNKPHLRDIYLQISGFDQWFTQQQNKFKVRILLKI